jgi:hypothetical protein
LKLDNPGLPEDLWEHIDEQLWHATARDGLDGIIADEEIRVAVCDRYAGSFSRKQGGGSLFDFGPTSEDVPNQFHNWCGWFGHQQRARVAVWLEIDRASVLESLMDAKAAREASKQDSGATFIPGVEACHKGPIPLAAVADVLLIDQHDWNLLRRLGQPNNDTIQQIDAFEATLPPHKDDPAVQILWAGRERARAKPSQE